jgi:predicted dehydrogenase
MSALPRLGFLGVGWIGRHRMQAVHDSGAARVVAVADVDPALARAAAAAVGAPVVAADLDALLEQELDGLVIATPNALHAEQSLRALQAGLAVFCQKPLARTAAECHRVVEAARRADRLLGVDFSYRHVEGMRRIRELIQQGELGRVFGVNLVFHNAYGPDKAWFHQRALAGGGCAMDLGIHLVDLALWALDFPAVDGLESRCLAGGEPLRLDDERVEDYAVARLHLADGAVVDLACSWNLPAGCDADIQASFYGTRGGAALRNVGGSFFDFEAHRFRGTARETLAMPPDDWGGRAIVEWARQLRRSASFDPGTERVVQVAQTLDELYRRGCAPAAPLPRSGTGS